VTPQQARRKREARRVRDREPIDPQKASQLLRELVKEPVTCAELGYEVTDYGLRLIASEDAADLRRAREAAGQAVLPW
jgi:hypothetical protein